MVDFLKISTRFPKKGVVEIYPKFIVRKSSDLMIRGRDFYAIWLEDKGFWSLDEEDAIQLIDKELDSFADQHASEFDGNSVHVLHMWDSDTKMIEKWHKYCQKNLRDNYHQLDERLIFSDQKPTKKDYASKQLDYPLKAGDISAYDHLIKTLYSPEEREKIEWAIGSIISGDSKKIQKFVVLYGAAGTGKSTILNIIQWLFNGYYCVFDAKALGSANSTFALEPFKSNPLVAIQHDGDLSRIEDNTRLNSLVSHEDMTVNEKFKATYSNRFNCFLFMGTNKPVKITDAKSGLIRRLIDVRPSGEKLSATDYKNTMSQVKFELGAIAKHCLDVYENDPGKYDSYIPTSMLGASNDFYNFVEDNYPVFAKNKNVTLTAAWEMYKTYCDDSKVTFTYPKRIFREELKNYFKEYYERYHAGDQYYRNYYKDFCFDKFSPEGQDEGTDSDTIADWLIFKEQPSKLDELLKDQPAQYASESGTPIVKWKNCKTTLKDLDTHRLHYVQCPTWIVTADFDIPDDEGNKCYERNALAASKWPKTYAELSKSGQGIHLTYIYHGDISEVSSIADDHVEIKLSIGDSSLRRMLTKCNDLDISEISSGLPKKEKKPVVNDKIVTVEKGIRTTIKKCLAREIHPNTKPSIDFIVKILDDAYNSKVKYDVTDLRPKIISFAAGSTHNSEYCLKQINRMHFQSDDPVDDVKTDGANIIFFDTEVFPNLFVVCWKLPGDENPVQVLINPTPDDISMLLKYDLVGFNCRRYDNHIMYACMLGYSPKELYNLSKKIVSGDRNCFFGEAYNLSYTDIYDFASSSNKKSLKKLEIEMKIHHKELGLPWDQPVPENMWEMVASYCKNDVIATEKAFNYLEADWTAREILADWTKMSVNSTTNTLTEAMIFGKNKNPQSEFCYRNMALPVHELPVEELQFLKKTCPEMMAQPFGKEKSLLPYFEGYEYRYGKSYYRGEEFGEGGYVYSETGIWHNVALLDIASMHPHSVIAECLFGPRYTLIFRSLVEARVYIKHKEYDKAIELCGEWIVPYIEKIKRGEISNKVLANGLKTAINSVYGLTSAKFDNPFRDKRNIDNIVAKRGELFMIDLKHAVQDRGFTVAHIKTDSIKVPDATPEIIKFIIDFGKRYGYTFEHEATYDRMCLVNKSTYIARFAKPEKCQELYGYIPDENKEGWEGSKRGWTATGDEFKVPYIFKTVFTKEPLEFDDFCETFETKAGDIYLDMNEDLPDTTDAEKELAKLQKKELDPGRQDELTQFINENHKLSFIGRVGQFTPVKKGLGGGVMYRVQNGKRYATPGSTGYRWLESETLRNLPYKEQNDMIDRSFYQKLADDAIDDVRKYGDFEAFVSD